MAQVPLVPLGREGGRKEGIQGRKEGERTRKKRKIERKERREGDRVLYIARYIHLLQPKREYGGKFWKFQLFPIIGFKHLYSTKASRPGHQPNI